MSDDPNKPELSYDEAIKQAEKVTAEVERRRHQAIIDAQDAYEANQAAKNNPPKNN